MTHGMSRRVLATAGAGLGLAAAGLGIEPAAAKRRKCRKPMVLVGVHGQVRKDRGRVVFPRVTHALRIVGDEHEIHSDHGALVPLPGTAMEYRVSGFEVRNEDTQELAPTPILFTVHATGGTYDPATGELTLDPVEVIDFQRGGESIDTSRCILIATLATGALIVAGVLTSEAYTGAKAPNRAQPRC